MTLVLGASFGSVYGQTAKDIVVSFPGEGDREVWIGSSSKPEEITGVQSAQGVSIIISPAGLTGNTVYVHDKKTGNVAEKLLSEVQRLNGWKVSAQDEKRVFALEFFVNSGGKAVASALVRAKVGNETRTILVSPTDNGKALLQNIVPGIVQVSVDYKIKNESKSSAVQSFEAKLGAGPAKPKSLVINDSVETVAPAQEKTEPSKEKDAEAKTEQSKTNAPPQAPNPLMSLVNLILGLGLVGGILYGIYYYIKKNPQQVEAHLQKFGLAQQEPVVDDTPPVPDQPQPLKPIDLGGGTATAAVSPIATSVAVSTPRLVNTDGEVVLLAEGESIVGREAGLAISFVGESSVSRQHAKIVTQGSTVTVSDLDSTNGTYVNGRKIAVETTLLPGDMVQFGAMGFRFEV